MKIFFSVGEPSGDLHGANLIRDLQQLRCDVECVGFGGPRMAAAGCRLAEDLTKLAVMGILPVLLKIHNFLLLIRQADRYFRDHHVDAVVLIDFPGFNWWVARKAKKYGIPVFYYGAPQLWAWGSWRIKRVQRFVDHVLCKLPFEEKWYRDRGCNATFVGHPYFDELQGQQLDEQFLQQHTGSSGPLVTILPGSRTQEVKTNLQRFLQAAHIIAKAVPDARFAVASFNEKQAGTARQIICDENLPIEVFVGRTPELIEAATCCMACSGSVSLELLYRTKPTVIHYWLNRFSYWGLVTLLATFKYITLINLLTDDDPFGSKPVRFDPDAPGADDLPMPEYFTCEDKSQQIARHVIEWLTDPQRRGKKVAQLEHLKSRFVQFGASRTAARYIVDALHKPIHGVPRPHFQSGYVGSRIRRESPVKALSNR